LNQGLHQGIVAFRAEVKQALIDRAAIAFRGVEDLAVALQRFAQAFTGLHDALGVGEPQPLVDASGVRGAFQNEVPAIHLGTGRHRGQSRAQA